MDTSFLFNFDIFEDNAPNIWHLFHLKDLKNLEYSWK
jgi:hypothetical protein